MASFERKVNNVGGTIAPLVALTNKAAVKEVGER